MEFIKDHKNHFSSHKTQALSLHIIKITLGEKLLKTKSFQPLQIPSYSDCLIHALPAMIKPVSSGNDKVS